MNQKDHKEIAKINKRNKKWFANEEVYALYCEQQADYFEREDKEEFMEKCDKIGVHQLLKFNREQFLKWCGVDDND